MTALTPHDTDLLLILGEMRGDLKAIAEGLGKMDVRVTRVEASADAQIEKLAGRVTKLEGIAIRMGTLAIGIGVLVSVTQPQLLKLAQLIFGG